MKTMLFLSLVLSYSESNSKSHRECYDLFKAENYVEVISQCESAFKDSTEGEFMYTASKMFLDISYSRISYIFYKGKETSASFYKYTTGKNLYSNSEKQHLNDYFPTMHKYADLGIPWAQLITAKIFYINEKIIKEGERNESTSGDYDEFSTGMNKYYLPNLEKIIALIPDHVEALSLLGIESFKTEYIMDKLDSDKKYFSIKNEKYYTYMLRAHELGHPGFKEVIDGVAAWKNHVRTLTEQAQNNNPESLYKLGQVIIGKNPTDEKTLTEALNYFQLAADQGHVGALTRLNWLYSDKMFDWEKYLETLKKLAELNDTKALVRLGDIYLCNNRKAEAKAYYTQAVNLNDPIAPYALEDLVEYGEPSSGCNQ